MKSIKSLFIAALTFSSVVVSAQTAEEIVAKNVSAMGGMEKLKSLNSIKMEGSLSTQGIDIPVTITTLRDKGLRLDLDIMGTAHYQVANTSKGVIFMPMAMGHTEPQEMSATEFASAKDQMNLVGTLASYKENGSKLEYLGIEEANSSPAHKIKLTKANGDAVTYYIDTKSYFVTKNTVKREQDGQTMDIETSFKDYKQNEQGYWFPYTRTIMSGDIVFSKISTNIAIDEKLFQP